MLYHRKVLKMIAVVLGTCWALTKAMELWAGKFILLVLIWIGGHLPIDVSQCVAKVQSAIIEAGQFSSKLWLCLELFAAMVVFWGILNILTGQLYRDFKSMQVTKFLRRNQKNLFGEERQANWWISKGRFVKRRKKMVLKIPCTNNSAVTRIIMKQCEQGLMKWLNDNFKKIDWQVPEVKNGGFISWIIVKQK